MRKLNPRKFAKREGLLVYRERSEDEGFVITPAECVANCSNKDEIILEFRNKVYLVKERGADWVEKKWWNANAGADLYFDNEPEIYLLSKKDAFFYKLKQ
jgi:hypothetical protein